MSLPTAGAISFNDLQTEFGGTHPIALNEFYAGGGLVPPAAHGPNGNVPTSGQIGMDIFYGSSSVPGVLSGTWTANSAESVQPFEIGLPTWFAGKYWALGNSPDYGVHTSTDGINWERETIVSGTGNDYSYSRVETKTVFEQDAKMLMRCVDSPSTWIMCSGGTSWSEPLSADLITEFNTSRDVEWIAPISKYILTYNDVSGMLPYPITTTTGMFVNTFPLPVKSTVNISGANFYTAHGNMVANNSGTTLLKSCGSLSNPGVFRSSDSGATWGFASGLGYTYGLAHSSTTNLFIACASGILKTSPNGTTWTTRGGATNPYWVAAKDNIVMAISNSNDSALDCSLTGGTTWQQVPGPGVFQQVTNFDIVNGRFFICGYISATHTLANYRIYSISATE